MKVSELRAVPVGAVVSFSYNKKAKKGVVISPASASYRQNSVDIYVPRSGTIEVDYDKVNRIVSWPVFS